MQYYKGYYSLIQYCPDPSRLEAANVGVLLLCPELRFVRVRLSHANSRIDRFFGHQDWDLIRAQKRAIEERIVVDAEYFRTLEDLQDYVSRRANEVQLSAPRTVKVKDAQLDLEDLFDRLVGEREQREPVHRAETLFKKEAERVGVDRLLKREVTVDIPTIDRTITAPYAYQNGVLNLIQPERFESPRREEVLRKTYRWAVEGQLLYETPNPKLGKVQLSVVGQFGVDSESEMGGIKAIFDRHFVKLYTFDHLSSLFDDIRRSTKDLSPV